MSPFVYNPDNASETRDLRYLRRPGASLNEHETARAILTAGELARVVALDALALDDVQSIALVASRYGQSPAARVTHAWGVPEESGAGLRAARRQDPRGVAAVLQVADDLGFSRAELAWDIGIESRWNPAARNASSNASGLIQWMPGTLRGMGAPSPEAVRAMSRREQAPLVRQYFARLPVKLTSPGDVYLAIFNPSGIGQPDDAVLYAPGSSGWTQNAGLREPNDGPITVGSVRRKGTPPPPQSFTDDTSGAAWLLGALLELPTVGPVLRAGGTDGETLGALLARDGYFPRDRGAELRAALHAVTAGLSRPVLAPGRIALAAAAVGLVGVAIGGWRFA